MAGDEKIADYWQKVADKLTNQGNYVSIFTQKDIPSENLNTLNISGTEHDVRFEKSKDADFHFSYYKKNDDAKIDFFKIEGSALSIDLKKLNLPKNQFKINFNFKSDENPSGFIARDVDQASIVIQVPEKIKNLKIETVSGEIKSNSLNFDEAIVSSVSGNLKLQGEFKSLYLSTVSGDIKLESGNAEPEAKIETVSGDIKISLDRQPGFKLTFNTTSGDVEIAKTIGGGEFEGDVKDLKIGSAAGTLAISTVSGDLRIEKIDGTK